MLEFDVQGAPPEAEDIKQKQARLLDEKNRFGKKVLLIAVPVIIISVLVSYWAWVIPANQEQLSANFFGQGLFEAMLPFTLLGFVACMFGSLMAAGLPGVACSVSAISTIFALTLSTSYSLVSLVNSMGPAARALCGIAIVLCMGIVIAGGGFIVLRIIGNLRVFGEEIADLEPVCEDCHLNVRVLEACQSNSDCDQYNMSRAQQGRPLVKAEARTIADYFKHDGKKELDAKTASQALAAGESLLEVNVQ